MAEAHSTLTQLTGLDAVAAIMVVMLPIAASLAVFLYGKNHWRGGAATVLVAVGATFAIMLRFLIRMLSGGEPVGWQVEWFSIGQYHFQFGFLFDNLSVWLATIVSLLSFLIVLFSTHYLHEEPNAKLRRYYAVKALFIAGMLGTVLMDNYLLMFIFWEIMGLCSYLLIGYWYHKDSAAIAAKKAFLTTRLGDILLMVGIILLLIEFKTLSYREIFANLEHANQSLMFWATLLIFGGAVGKSAQWPLDIWLPDAMEGPTTVSALIHAATMVKAGVFLVARSFPLFVINPELFVVVGVIGGITALYTATMALTALDIKRVLAFSTLSQLGYMFLALGAGGIVYVESANGVGFTAAMLHLMNHAFFKALLFLGSASVILGMHHHQDLRDMGGLRHKMPKTYATMMVGTLAIAGIIPFSGFWSKDEVLATAFKAGAYENVFLLLWVMGVLTALMTAFYMFRMMFLAFHGEARTKHAEEAHESPGVMTGPLIMLAVFAAIAGLWLVAPIGDGFESVITYPYSEDLGHPHHMAPLDILKGIMTEPKTYLSLGVAVAGIVLARRYAKGVPASEADEPAKADVEGLAQTLWMAIGAAVALPVIVMAVLGALLAALSIGGLAVVGLGSAAAAVAGFAVFLLKIFAVIGGIIIAGASVLVTYKLISAGGVRGYLYHRYYVTEMVYEPLGNYVAVGTAAVSQFFDTRGIDGAVNGIASVAMWKGAFLRRMQDGRLTTYLSILGIGAALILAFLVIVVPGVRW